MYYVMAAHKDTWKSESTSSWKACLSLVLLLGWIDHGYHSLEVIWTMKSISMMLCPFQNPRKWVWKVVVEDNARPNTKGEEEWKHFGPWYSPWMPFDGPLIPTLRFSPCHHIWWLSPSRKPDPWQTWKTIPLSLSLSSWMPLEAHSRHQKNVLGPIAVTLQFPKGIVYNLLSGGDVMDYGKEYFCNVRIVMDNFAQSAKQLVVQESLIISWARLPSFSGFMPLRRGRDNGPSAPPFRWGPACLLQASKDTLSLPNVLGTIITLHVFSGVC